ncbi:hypothetical protein FJQ98_24070 [Lysinibacillus agricola]|uniref:Transporter n=1 Tax=Lysinibacillus agricola TaxID=2590012 RepID=A0ABX7AQR2_9BACI|nr:MULTISPECIES: hypothetical protein [Lysinibacillus]KOS63292.1 hypothetical protein AN161_08730 [Lysinibacillus sp. FJAT-14222]QQP12141.1 hypothetical protein FJQ98_24070 [Lysinibacillus agricola]
MKKSLQIGGAYVGIIVGAGFASGQEIVLYFTSYGFHGIYGALIATFGFALVGMCIAQISSRLRTTSHKDLIYQISGNAVGLVMDYLLSLFLFGVAVIMFAGAGATFQQMFGLPVWLGSICMIVLTIATVMMNVKSIINIIAIATPYLLTIVSIIAVYSLATMDLTFVEQAVIAQQAQVSSKSWWVTALLYMSFNIGVCFSLLTVMCGSIRNEKVAGMGGIIGGILLGALILLINLSLLAKMNVIVGIDIPMLALANEIHPLVGLLMSISLLGMIYNTAVGMFYSFLVRFLKPSKPSFKVAAVFIGGLSFLASLAGFTTLVAKLYAVMGYVGFILVVLIIFAWLRGIRRIA